MRGKEGEWRRRGSKKARKFRKELVENKVKEKVKRRKVEKDMEEDKIKGLEKEIEGWKTWKKEAEKK